MAHYLTASKLVEALIAKGLSVATAESCTGGGVAHAITAVPGASAVFKGSVVSYANEVKESLLGVRSETLKSVGAVSKETVEQMASGARKLLNVDIAVSLTGIAGPDGGTALKPVGLVWFGYADSDGVKSVERRFEGSREEVREAAIAFALELLNKMASGERK